MKIITALNTSITAMLTTANSSTAAPSDHSLKRRHNQLLQRILRDAPNLMPDPENQLRYA